MTTAHVEVFECDLGGVNCTSSGLVELSSITGSPIEAGSAEYADVIWSFALLMAVVWTTKAILKFIRR